jgi:hypothetical protein
MAYMHDVMTQEPISSYICNHTSTKMKKKQYYLGQEQWIKYIGSVPHAYIVRFKIQIWLDTNLIWLIVGGVY